MAESEEELKTLLMKVKEENEKLGLKLNIHVPDLGRVAPGWWRLSHISEGQNNSLFIPAWLLLCAHAWFMPWTRGEKKVSSLSPFVQMNVENPVAPGDGRIDERKSLGL